jgi:DNA replication protein DnaC
MLIEQTLEKMNAMKLNAMAEALVQQRQSAQSTGLGFEDRLGLLVEAEWTGREQRKLTRRLRTAKLRQPSASLEGIDFKRHRQLDRSQVLDLGACGWIAERHNLILTGPAGAGKSYLCCAFIVQACRRGFAGAYTRMPRLLHELAVARGDGSYARLLARLGKLDLLAIDDWLLAPLRDSERRDLMEIIEERSERGSTIIAGQLPIADWHASIGDPNQADAICDRVLHNAHRIALKGASVRNSKAAPKMPKGAQS